MGAMGTTTPNFSVLNPKSWMPQTAATGNDFGTPEGDKALESGLQHIDYLPGWAGLTNIGKGISNGVIMNKLFANQRGRQQSSAQALSDYTNNGVAGSAQPTPSQSSAPQWPTGMASARPSTPSSTADLTATPQPEWTKPVTQRPAITGGNPGSPGGMGMTSPVEPSTSPSLPPSNATTPTQADVDKSTPDGSPTGASLTRGMAGPMPPKDQPSSLPTPTPATTATATPAPTAGPAQPIQQSASPVPSTTTPQAAPADNRNSEIESKIATIDDQIRRASRLFNDPNNVKYAESEVARLQQMRNNYDQIRIKQMDPQVQMQQRATEMQLKESEQKIRLSDQNWKMQQELFGGSQPTSNPAATAMGSAPAQQQQMTATAGGSGAPDSSSVVPINQRPQDTQPSGVKMNPNAPDIQVPDLSARAIQLQRQGTYYAMNGNRAGVAQVEAELKAEPSYLFRQKEIERLGADAGKRAQDKDAAVEALDVFDKMRTNADMWHEHAPNAFNGAIGPIQSGDTYQAVANSLPSGIPIVGGNKGAQDFHTRLRHDADAIAVQLRKISGSSHSSDASDKTFKDAIGKAIESNNYENFNAIMGSARNVILKAGKLPTGYQLPSYNGKIDPEEADAINVHASKTIDRNNPNVNWPTQQSQPESKPQASPTIERPHDNAPGAFWDHPQYGVMQKSSDGKWYPHQPKYGLER